MLVLVLEHHLRRVAVESARRVRSIQARVLMLNGPLDPQTPLETAQVAGEMLQTSPWLVGLAHWCNQLQQRAL